MSSGTTVKAVLRMLGHASAAMTLHIQAGLFDDDLSGLAERMDAAAATYTAHAVGDLGGVGDSGMLGSDLKPS